MKYSSMAFAFVLVGALRSLPSAGAFSSVVVSTAPTTTSMARHASNAMVNRCGMASVRTSSSSSSSVSIRTRATLVRHFAVDAQHQEVDPGTVEGTNLRIVKYPDPALRAPNMEITMEELEDGSIQKIAKEMLLVMYAAEGVGLAAPQVGINKRLMVFNESGDPKKWLTETILVNPKIVEFAPTTDVHAEGCLSFPNMNGDVERSKWIKVEAMTTKGKKVKKKYTGWEARVFQHEYDHLDGKVYIDRLDEENRKNVQPVLDELIQEFGPGGAL